MSANYIHTIADENPGLHKQLGCMTGIFQIFNRQHFVGGRRRISSHSKEKLTPGESSNSRKEPDHTTQKSTDKNLMDVKDREKTSVESPRNSFSSSSCSSTFTSIDSSKLSQTEPSVLGHSPLSKNPSQVPKKQPNFSLESSHGSPDIRDIVKNSIKRETCDLTIKTKKKPEGKIRVMKHIDSPRPQQVSKPVSPRVSKERNSTVPPKEGPRFSYDERESRDKWKSVGKVRELPRYSLDSRESSIRKAASEDLKQRSDQRLSSVVAKLMGLEDFPNPKETKNLDPISTLSSSKHDEKIDKQISKSPRLTPKDTSSLKLRNTNSSAKPNTRFPLEPAPWILSQNSTAESQLKPQTVYPSVYGQIEKRLMEIEFKKSGKDLRALKQIVEAMQKERETIEDKKDESSYKTTTPTIKRIDSRKKLEASIAISRSAKVLPRTKISASSPLPMEGVPSLPKLRIRDNSNAKKDMIPRKIEFRESSGQSLNPMAKRSSGTTYRSKQTSVSPRMGKQSEASTPRKAVKRHDTEIVSPSRKFKPKSRVLKNHDDDRFSEISSEERCLSHQGDVLSACSESNRSIASQNDEVTSNCRSEVTFSLDEFKQKFGTTPGTFEQPSPISVLDTSFYAEGSPSPVKKISSAFTDPDTLSSDETVFNPLDLVNFQNTPRPDLVPEFGEKLENLENLNDKIREAESHDDEANAENTESLCESTDPTHRYVDEILSASGILKDLGPSSTFTQLHESGGLINPHLFQILEQTKSRIEVKDEEHINGKINQSKLHEKMSRKLIFDTTDEILVNILISSGFSDPWISPNKMGLKSLTGKKLFEKICSGMNDLQINFECSLPYKDDTIPLEISGVVLDIERLIFKDLISEIVSGEAGLPSWLNKPRRQLFTN